MRDVRSNLPRWVAVAGALTIMLAPPATYGQKPDALTGVGKSALADPNAYLNAVREFADNVLKYGRDTYGPKHTPLFVDGLNVNTHEPVKWINPDGYKWVLSNFASQQNLLRTLDELSSITGDPKYRDAAIQATKYMFENLQAPNRLLYWGHEAAYDALGDKVFTEEKLHVLKMIYPYYELMWQVDPEATKRFIEAFWSAHIIDWSNLDMDRIAYLTSVLEEPWNREYKGRSDIFHVKGNPQFSTATSLIYAGATLYKLSHQEQPYIWSKRLARQYIDTRHPNTGISPFIYIVQPMGPIFGGDMKEHFVDPHTTLFPINPFDSRYLLWPEDAPEAQHWISMLLVGRMLGEEGRDFNKWSLEELTAWGKCSYRRTDNSFVPILTDGTSIEGYVSRTFPDGLNVARPLLADTLFFWAYALLYRETSDAFIWQMVRDIAFGNGLGDIGKSPVDKPRLQIDTACSSAYAIFGLLELYAKTNKVEFLPMAQRVGDNIIDDKFHKGFFVPSKKHIHTRFDCFEPIALLHLNAIMKSRPECVTQVWPNNSQFVPRYRHMRRGVDRHLIYTLTDTTEPPLSLQEAAAIGDVNMVSHLLEKGELINGSDNPFFDTALHRAAICGYADMVTLLLNKGAWIDAKDSFPGATALHCAVGNAHKDIVELLIARGANVNVTRDDTGDTALHIAVKSQHKDIAELLITKGTDINAENSAGKTALDIALEQDQKDIIELLMANGAETSSIYVAAGMGDLAKVREFIEKGADVNMRYTRHETALHIAALNGYKEIVELLLAHGADVNASANYGKTAAELAMFANHREIVELLISKGADIPPLHFALYTKDQAKAKSLIEGGADVNKRTSFGIAPLHIASAAGFKDIAELLLAKGADVNAKENWNWTPLHDAAENGHKDIVELLIAKGADVIKNDNGRDPLWYAEEKGYTDIVELLRQYEAKKKAEETSESTNTPQGTPGENKTAPQSQPQGTKPTEPNASSPAAQPSK
jgi:pectate lyase